jgi:hypothetical protein
MAKTFMYVCVGILALVAAFHLGARYGEAQTWVDHASGGIVAFHPSMVLLENGEVWDVAACPRAGRANWMENRQWQSQRSGSGNATHSSPHPMTCGIVKVLVGELRVTTGPGRNPTHYL